MIILLTQLEVSLIVGSFSFFTNVFAFVVGEGQDIWWMVLSVDVGRRESWKSQPH